MSRRTATTAAVAALALAGAAALSGCSGSSPAAAEDAAPHLEVSGAYVPRPVLADTATAYFTVRNTGGTDDRLTRVTSDLAPMVTLDITADNTMRTVKSLPVPAGGTLHLRTGGNHLMLMHLRDRPAVGDTVTLHLTFATSAPVTVKAPVKPATYQPAN
ncbi:copper chaperone PCu(A)C [Streptomyces sp. TS71-3]|uniref:copper chaperone PCu(A)C n=1 Tax=Streptomyces sp. TS71-3 TaxID=2733862 RepID=UPI001B222FDB|nr:copper chaperone PCu(A)C [Streptomyces sp. TS71-3]GHJ41273.1 hypothetical protein Sm713_68820 [Streptomyces sp. TS71-3]